MKTTKAKLVARRRKAKRCKAPEEIADDAYRQQAKLTYNLAKIINTYNLLPNNYKSFLRWPNGI